MQESRIELNEKAACGFAILSRDAASGSNTNHILGRGGVVGTPGALGIAGVGGVLGTLTAEVGAGLISIFAFGFICASTASRNFIA